MHIQETRSRLLYYNRFGPSRLLKLMTVNPSAVSHNPLPSECQVCQLFWLNAMVSSLLGHCCCFDKTQLLAKHSNSLINKNPNKIKWNRIPNFLSKPSFYWPTTGFLKHIITTDALFSIDSHAHAAQHENTGQLLWERQNLASDFFY